MRQVVERTIGATQLRWPYDLYCIDKQRNLNGLLKAVKYDLSVSMHIAGCKALGLISKLVTRLLWTVIEDREIHILQMNQYVQELIAYLDRAQKNDVLCSSTALV